MVDTGRHRFIIGIGSQRAGSTLLHSLLESSSEVFMHPLKELHYFDTLYGYRSSQALQEFSDRQIVREIDRIVSSNDLEFVKNNRYKCYLRTNRLLARLPIEKINYLDLFRPNLKNHQLLGEVTPEYMLFNEESIVKMREIIGDDAGIVLICRNPVRRFLSAVKLMNSYNNLQMNDDAANEWIEYMLDSDNAWIQAQDKYNNYAAAIDLYSQKFSKFIAISYDNLIKKPISAAKKISEITNISINEKIFSQGLEKIVNNLGENHNISQKILLKIEKRYELNQSFLNDYFNHELVR